MKVIYGLKRVKRFKSPVAAIGVFDGIHRGHRRILESAVRQARRIKGTSIVLTFWPDPHKEATLYSLRHKLRLIESIGVNVCVVLNFSRRFSGMSAEGFVKKILINKLNAEYVYVGSNFRFGRNAQGNIPVLKKLSRIYGFKLNVFNVIKRNNVVISSTNIRKSIAKGNLKAAANSLGRPFSILGKVIKGCSQGAGLGFPTANIEIFQEAVPHSGVYAVNVILGKKTLPAIGYIGNRPTFARRGCLAGASGINNNIEVHIFDFHRNIYNREIEVQFIKKIRDERKFDSSAALVEQIKKDVYRLKKESPRH